MTGLPSPLFERGRITTLIAPIDDELAALAAAIAVSYRTGCPLIPGFTPEGPGELTAYCYRFAWIEWKALIGDICSAAAIPAPLIALQCLSTPLIDEVAAIKAERDPDAAAYWDRFYLEEIERDLAMEKAAGYRLPPHFTIVFGLDGAAGPGDEALRRLYDSYRGDTVLMAGTEMDVPWAAEYGSVIELPSLHDSVGWRDVLARVTGGDVPESDQPTVERDAVPGDAAVAPERTWNAAKLRGRDVAPPDSGLGTLYGFGAVYGQWKEVNERLKGHYLERLAPGAFTTAIAERPRMKVCFRHGQDPRFGFRSLGPLSVLEESELGVWYEVALVDGDHTRALMAGLIAGEYRSSITYEVIRDHLVKNPDASEHNPEALPELTILEVRCSELGPCEHPAYAGTSASIRLAD